MIPCPPFLSLSPDDRSRAPPVNAAARSCVIRPSGGVTSPPCQANQTSPCDRIQSQSSSSRCCRSPSPAAAESFANTYTPGAVQPAAKVDQGVIVGMRPVDITTNGAIGAATGGAAGGIIGSQAPGGGMGSAIGAVGGSLVGGLLGTTVEHVAGDATAFEYVVREKSGDMVSVTQKDAKPLHVGQAVLVIAGPRPHRPDYTTPDVTTPDIAAAPHPPATRQTRDDKSAPPHPARRGGDPRQDAGDKAACPGRAARPRQSRPGARQRPSDHQRPGHSVHRHDIREHADGALIPNPAGRNSLLPHMYNQSNRSFLVLF